MSDLDDILKHAGVKGMKWGVRKSEKKSRKKIDTMLTSKSYRKFDLNTAMRGNPSPTPAGLALRAASSVVKTSRAKKKVASAFNMSPKDFNKKDLRFAAKMVKSFTNLELVVDNKSVIIQSAVNQTNDILQHAGVKGMKWGVRKDRGGKVSKSAKKAAKKEKASANLEKYHTKSMKKSKQYKKLYEERRRNGSNHEASAKFSRNIIRGNKIAKAYLAYQLFGPRLTPYGKAKVSAAAKSFVKVGSREAYNRVYNAATSDKVVRTGKNIVNTIKRNNIRVVNAADFDWNNIIHQSASLDDALQHHGVKGMKWGVRRSASALRKARKENNKKVDSDVASGKMTKKEGKIQKLENYHKSKQKGFINAGYQNDYQRARILGSSHHTAIRQARASNRVANAMTMSMGAVGVAGLAGQGAGAAYRKIATPENIRKAKNIVLAAKRSPIRVVDGSAMTNVIKANLQNRISQWSDSLDDSLQHHGVKGMKWGVIRSRSAKAAARAGRSVQNGVKRGNAAVIDKVKTEVNSIKRENSWSKIKVDGMSTAEISKVAQRAQLENDFKRMSRNKQVGTKAERKAYKKRESMSDSELLDSVTRLRAKDNLNRNMREASKTQRTLARNVIDAAGPLAVKAVLKKKIGITDVMTAVETLKRKNEAVEPGRFKQELGTAAFGVVRKVKEERIADQ